MTISHDLLRLKLDESLAVEPFRLARRDVRQPGIPGKAFGVIGARRGGKTSFLAQFRNDFLADGPTVGPLLSSLEDERGGPLRRRSGVDPDARPFLVTLDAVPPRRPLPDGLTWAPAARWLLDEM